MKKKTAARSKSLSVESLLKNPDVYEVIVDAWDEVHYVERGELRAATGIFAAPKAYEDFVARLLKTGKQAPGQGTYYFSLDPLTNVTVVLPPLSLRGPAVVVTKLSPNAATMDDLVKWGALATTQRELLLKTLERSEGVLVAGNIGSGKTTLLNVLVDSIPKARVVTIERSADLVLRRKLVTRLSAPSAKDVPRLLETVESLRADYLVLSDARGPEVMPFIDFVRYNCSGIALTSATDVLDAVKRIETKALISSDGLSLEDVRYALAQVFRLVVFQEKLPDGKRKVTNISRISYVKGELVLAKL
jgi:pilus assembly protein CpaF